MPKHELKTIFCFPLYWFPIYNVIVLQLIGIQDKLNSFIFDLWIFVNNIWVSLRSGTVPINSYINLSFFSCGLWRRISQSALAWLKIIGVDVDSVNNTIGLSHSIVLCVRCSNFISLCCINITRVLTNELWYVVILRSKPRGIFRYAEYLVLIANLNFSFAFKFLIMVNNNQSRSDSNLHHIFLNKIFSNIPIIFKYLRNKQ